MAPAVSLDTGMAMLMVMHLYVYLPQIRAILKPVTARDVKVGSRIRYRLSLADVSSARVWRGEVVKMFVNGDRVFWRVRLLVPEYEEYTELVYPWQFVLQELEAR
jgi:hypothetical protein